jgi:hypothetical protein
MPEPHELSKCIGALCAKRDTDIYKLGPKLGIEPKDQLAMINRQVVPTKAVIDGSRKNWIATCHT